MVTVNGINYLEFKGVLKTKKQADILCDRVKSFSGIMQEFSVDESFWNGTKVSFKCLIPEKYALLFSNIEQL